MPRIDRDKPIELIPGVTEQAEAFLGAHPDTRERFGRVVGLIEGFETPFGMELLSTVHWVATREGASTAERAMAGTYAWSDRKRIFTEDHVRTGWEVLDERGWLSGAKPR
jgi:hypothetical protein